MPQDTFENSPEHEDWIQETGGSDDQRSDYYEQYDRRTRNEDNED